MSDTSNARQALEEASIPGDPPETEVPSLDQAVLDEFERRAQEANSDEDNATGTEGENDTTPPEGGADASGTDDAGDEPTGEDGTPPGGSTASTEGSSEGSEPPPPPAQPYVTLGERQFTEAEIQQAVQIRDWATSLTPDQQRSVDALFSGQYQLVPVGETPKPEPSPSGTTPGTTPGITPGAPSDIPAEEWEELPESFRQQFVAMQERVNALAQGDMEARRQQVVESLSSGAQTFMQRHGLDEGGVQVIQDRLASLGVMPGYVQAANGDYARAMDMALEAVYWSDENFRQAEIERQAAAQVEAERERARADAQRQRKAGALSGSSGSVPRERSGPLTPADRKAAMTREVAEAMGRGTPSN